MMPGYQENRANNNVTSSVFPASPSIETASAQADNSSQGGFVRVPPEQQNQNMTLPTSIEIYGKHAISYSITREGVIMGSFEIHPNSTTVTESLDPIPKRQKTHDPISKHPKTQYAIPALPPPATIGHHSAPYGASMPTDPSLRSLLSNGYSSFVHDDFVANIPQDFHDTSGEIFRGGMEFGAASFKMGDEEMGDEAVAANLKVGDEEMEDEAITAGEVEGECIGNGQR